jgi:hypothetical protein
MKFVILKVIFLFLLFPLSGQEYSYWVYLKHDADKNVVHDLLNNQCTVEVTGYSNWLHAFAVKASPSYNLKHKLVAAIERQVVLQPLYSNQPDKVMLGFALEQIEADLLVKENFTGAGVSIGIIDGGFMNADTDPALSHLFKISSILSYRDYVTPNLEAYKGSKALDDRHGTDVLQLIGGYNDHTKVLHGLATDAKYHLARTDHGAYESRIEEFYLIQALERMDSLGVRVVNISLGYTDGYTDTAENYSVTDMNGSTAIARAVQIAFHEKGMLIVVAAGNDGDKEWKVVSAPADAQGALTVGSTKYDHWSKASFSSIGPSQLAYMKPEIVCFANAGTSFSAPIITGLAAVILQKHPDLTQYQLKSIIMRSGHLYPYGNNYVGYGVPKAANILSILAGDSINSAKELKSYKNRFSLQVRGEKHAVLYHKSDGFRVIQEDYLELKNNKIRINRLGNARFTTVVIDNDKVIEIRWMQAN